ncbi:MAG: protein TolA [Hyphomicrobium sp.]|nr:MAG: protein TolA [Hyphomicrobium sp.]PPD01672.1 MAG: protein TolA [Hyphomicrobium sp.]
MPFGLFVSLICHGALIGWAYLSMRAVDQLDFNDTPSISAEIITPSEFLRLKQGDENAKQLETKAKDEPTPDDSKQETKKPDNAPPPPPPPPAEDVAAVEPPAPPEPPKPVEPEPVKVEEPPPPPPPPAEAPPPPGPTPEEQKLLEQKIEEERLAEEAKKKAEEEAKKKAEAEAKKKAEDEAKKKKLAEEARKKKLAEAKRKKEEEAKKKFDPSKIASLLDKAPDDSQPKALIDKDPTKKGQQASGSSKTATASGREAGTETGTDTVLSAREQDLLKGMLKAQLAECWRPPGTGGGSDVPVVALHWQLKPDGSLDGDPRVTQSPSTAAGQVYAEAALRAVRDCSPFRLPPEQYEGGWKIIDWVFDPRQML